MHPTPTAKYTCTSYSLHTCNHHQSFSLNTYLLSVFCVSWPTPPDQGPCLCTSLPPVPSGPLNTCRSLDHGGCSECWNSYSLCSCLGVGMLRVVVVFPSQGSLVIVQRSDLGSRKDSCVLKPVPRCRCGVLLQLGLGQTQHLLLLPALCNHRVTWREPRSRFGSVCCASVTSLWPHLRWSSR